MPTDGARNPKSGGAKLGSQRTLGVSRQLKEEEKRMTGDSFHERSPV
jgi:hypothetical protein